MSDKLNLKERLLNIVRRKRKVEEQLIPVGTFVVEHWRKGVLLKTIKGNNLVVNEGKNSILDVYFHSATQIATASWFMGLINITSYTNIVAGDTAASHAGWTEFTAYDEAARPAWGQGAASGQSVTNASAVAFSINTTGTVKGIFIISNSTKSGTSGKLWSAMLFPTGDTAVVDGDELRATYAIGL